MHNIYYDKPMKLNDKLKRYIKEDRNYQKYSDKDSLDYILSNSEHILKDLDSAVSLYQEETEYKVNKLQTNEFYILVLIMLTLALEALFIFRPANNSIKEKTQELQEQKKYADMITQTNTNAIIAVNQKFEIMTFNKSAEDMFGYRADEMIGQQLTDDKIIPLKYLPMHNEGLANFMESGKLKYVDEVFELDAHTKDKKLFPIRISFGVRVEDGSKVVVANIQNITKEKEKDALILQQSRHAVMGEMIGNIAHQWRQPLSSISTIATGANLRYKNKLLSDEELDEVFVKIKDHTLHLSKTIDDFREFFHEDSAKELFEIKDVIEHSIVLTEATYKENNIKLSFSQDDSSLSTKGSASKFSQVILNILNNARDALIENNIENRMVFIDVTKEDDFIILKIQDNAGGIPEDIIEKIFDPYFTTKHKSQGTGVGLFMSNKIISQHFDGSISVKNKMFVTDSNEHLGAEFTISINIT